MMQIFRLVRYNTCGEQRFDGCIDAMICRR